MPTNNSIDGSLPASGHHKVIGRIDFDAVNREALSRTPAILMDWLPGGKLLGKEYLALNPTRDDRKLGSFSINIVTGKWGDFATGDRGGDLVSLYAYIHGIGQGESVRELAERLGVNHV